MTQRVEIITGKERRRRWGAEEKARLVSETLEPGAVVAHVARRHGVAESCLYTWRKQLVGMMPEAGCLTPLIPVMLDGPVPAEPTPASASSREPWPRALITFADGTRAEIGADYPAQALLVLVAALRSRS